MARTVLFLSDYGLDDEFVGICHAVIAAAAPDVRVIDLSHGVSPQDVRRGALMLAAAVPYGPSDAVYLAVVDPGVGTDRRAVVVEAGGSLFLGPDNGVLSLAWEGLGGAARAFAIEHALPADWPATFHGRDIFAPAAARLAAGAPPDSVGPALDPSSLVRLDLPRPRRVPDGLVAEVIGVDRFGNVQLGVRGSDVAGAPEALDVRAGGATATCRRVRTFAEVPPGELGVLVDSAGWLAVVAPRANAAAILGIQAGEEVLLSWPAWDSGS